MNETVKKKLQASYDKQMGDDGALDLFDPSVELLIAPYYDKIRPLLNPASEDSVFVKLFAEYFTRKGLVNVSRGAGGEVAVTVENIPLLLPTDCNKKLIDTWSIPRPCLSLTGTRGTYAIEFNQLFIGDLVWLYYYERMGVHRMVGALLDDFVTRGKYPIRPSGVEGLILEGMVREVKAGLSSTVRERDTSYRRCLGWTSEAGGKLDNPDAPMNSNFNTLFHRLVNLALGYYNEKRLAVAIQASSTNAGKPSRATLTSLKETIGQLRRAFDPFKYGRNHTHALSGIVWTLAGFELVLRLRAQLGIPEPYQQPEELIPAAYDLLIGNGVKVAGNGNRYLAHRDCAQAGRDILLDVQGLDFDAIPFDETDLAAWLDDVETRFELYRSAYRVLTGTDLGTTQVAVVQAA